MMDTKARRAAIEYAAHMARDASALVAIADTERKNEALRAMARGLVERCGEILAANASDVDAARAAGLADAMIDRLTLTEARVRAVADGVLEVAALPDPVGEISQLRRRPNGLLVGRMRIPLGVIAIIYEARPGVAADAAALCLKSGNAVVLRGGSDAARSNAVIGEVLSQAVAGAGLPPQAVTVVNDTGRDSIAWLVQVEDAVDLAIPRGGEGLIRFVTENARVPVLKHYKGVCHLYVDEWADGQIAVDLAVNGKTQRPGVCNALETILFHERVAGELLPRVCGALAEMGVEIRGCEKTRALFPAAATATDEDWATEYLDLIVSVRVVADMDEAIRHIRLYGSGHTEAIVTAHHTRAMEFLRRVDSSTVLVNASTRFADGHQLGLGAEIGISTSKMHAYGPMGLEGLTTQKFIVFGDGQIRA